MSDVEVYRRGDVLWRRISDRVIILVPANGEFVTLQATGCDLWAALETPGPVSELAERLASAYGEPIERVAADIAPALEELRRGGAVTVSRRL